MPSSGGINDELIVQAVREGTLDEKVIDQACARILDVIFRYAENREEEAVFDHEHDHRLAAELEAECMVLLKNEGKILPLNPKSKIAFIGKYAETPRYQGGGSSHINSWKVESALEAVKGIADVIFARGFADERDEVQEELQAEAIKAAVEVDVAVIFAGLPDNFESEGYDRKHMNLPDCQNTLIMRILDVQKNVIVVLHNGSPVLMPWKDQTRGILEAYLGGEAVGKAVVDVLFGRVNPSGRLAETFPERLEDTPCYLTYGKGKEKAIYQEGVFVGYRYYTSRNMKAAFPFGYGLSYTDFSYSGLTADRTKIKDTELLTVHVNVKNTGSMAGKEVVQFYVAPPEGNTVRPLRELRGFEKVALESGEEKTVTFCLDMRAFAYWNTELHDWYVEDGDYRILIGRNAEEMVLETAVAVYGTKSVPKVYSLNSCLGDLMRDPKAQSVVEPFVQGMAENSGSAQAEGSQGEETAGVVNAEMMAAMMEDMPLRQLLSFMPGMKREVLEQIEEALNA